MIDEHVMQWLLEADIAALEGRGGSELARLVREDPEVRSAAHRITAVMRETDNAMATAAAGLSTLSSVAAPAADRPADVDPARLRTRPQPRAVATLAVAAAAIAVFVIATDSPAPSPQPGEQAEPITATLEVSSSRPFAVFPTDNPDIAIVWLFAEEEQ